MNRWIDLDELRRDIAAEAKARALAAGLEGVTVRVTIAEPDRRQRRSVTIDVEAPPSDASALPEVLAELQRLAVAGVGVPAELMRGGAAAEYPDTHAHARLALARRP